MRIGDFDLYRDILKAKCGLFLMPDKSYLLDSRLSSVAKKWDYTTMEALTLALRGVPEPDLIRDIVEAMVPTDTSFFRDLRPFNILSQVILPYLADKRKSARSLRIWCAACSTGQEPYSVSMILNDHVKSFPGWKTQILATDISTEALAMAKRGRYSQFDSQRGLPVRMLINHFEPAGADWMISDDIKRPVKFEAFNLLDSMEGLGDFDIVLCRNVLSGFDEATRASVVKRIAERMPEDGFLILGRHEPIQESKDLFVPHKTYRHIHVRPHAKHNLDSVAAARAVK